MAHTNKIIVGGDVGEGVIEWLQEHHARIETCLGLTIVELPAKAHVDKEGQEWHYSVWFYDQNGEQEETYLDIEHYANDEQETEWRLKQQ